jgi:hypothetical protein
MRAILAVTLSCTPVNRFTATITDGTRPGRTTTTLECLRMTRSARTSTWVTRNAGQSMEDALPRLRKPGRMAGGGARLKIETQQLYFTVKAYRAAVIRYAGVAAADSTGTQTR